MKKELQVVPVNSTEVIPIKPADRPTIIIDSCIIQYFGDKNIGPGILSCLQMALNTGYNLCISEATIFEMLDGADLKTEKDRIDTLKVFSSFPITSDRLIAAAQLGTLYKYENIPEQQISAGDKIIAATAMLTSSLILTANGRDFPLPFFQTITSVDINYKKGKSQHCITAYFLAPNVKTILTYWEKRNSGSAAHKKPNKHL